MTQPASLTAHRLRILTHQFARYVGTLNELTPEQRSELGAFGMTVLRHLDALAPLHAPTDPACDVIQLRRPTPCRGGVGEAAPECGCGVFSEE